MKIHYTHANFRVPPAQKLDRPQGFSTSKKHFPIFFHFHSHAIFTLNGQQYKLPPHTCVIVGPHTQHALEVEKTILHDWIIFDGEEDFMPLLESLGLALDTFYYPESHEKITSLCERIEHHWFGGDDYFSVYFETRMRDLLILLAREKNRNPEPDDSRNMPSDAHLHRLRQHLLSSPNLTNYKEENAVSMAQASRSTLFRRYRALFGCSPYEDLQNACIKRGERYLLETNFTVQEISELLGYRSANVFIQRFKRHYGQTPNEWRKKERNAVKTQEERTTP